MSRNNQDLSRALQTTLGLKTAPVALSRAERAPKGVPSFSGSVPSACAFWKLAERDRFFASADAHENCPVGVYTLGLPLTEGVKSNLQTFLGKMCEHAYVAEEEVAKIPRMEGAPSGYVYGPLAQFEERPEIVLAWVNARQAMVLEEAIGSVAWGSPATRSLGRPACAALPEAAKTNGTALSFGCSGMRTFTEVGDELHLVAIPREALDAVAEGLQKADQSNQAMLEFYRGHKAAFPRL